MPSTFVFAAEMRPRFQNTEWESLAQFQADRGAFLASLWFGLWLAPSGAQAAWGPRVFDTLAPPGWKPTLGPQGSVLAAGPNGRRVVFVEDGGSFTPETWGQYEVRLVDARPTFGQRLGLAWLQKQWARSDYDRFVGTTGREEPQEPHAVAGQPRAETEGGSGSQREEITPSLPVAKGYQVASAFVEAVVAGSTDPRDPDRDPRRG